LYSPSHFSWTHALYASSSPFLQLELEPLLMPHCLTPLVAVLPEVPPVPELVPLVLLEQAVTIASAEPRTTTPTMRRVDAVKIPPLAKNSPASDQLRQDATTLL